MVDWAPGGLCSLSNSNSAPHNTELVMIEVASVSLLSSY